MNLVPTDAAKRHRAAELPIHSPPYVDVDSEERIEQKAATDSSAAVAD